ncbi:MAG: hypothetical protein WCP89_04590 [archaeon]
MKVEDLRRLLGSKYDSLPDTTLQGIIDLFRAYAKLAISKHITEKKKARAEEIRNR